VQSVQSFAEDGAAIGRAWTGVRAMPVWLRIAWLSLGLVIIRLRFGSTGNAQVARFGSRILPSRTV
jgi:hypothetical protein